MTHKKIKRKSQKRVNRFNFNKRKGITTKPLFNEKFSKVSELNDAFYEKLKLKIKLSVHAYDIDYVKAAKILQNEDLKFIRTKRKNELDLIIEKKQYENIYYVLETDLVKLRQRIEWTSDRIEVSLKIFYKDLMNFIDIREIGVKEFSSSGLSGLLSHHFDNSPYKVMKYMGYDKVIPCLDMRKVPSNVCLDDIEIQKIGIDNIIEKVQKEGRTKDKIMEKDFIELGYGKLLNRFKNIKEVLDYFDK